MLPFFIQKSSEFSFVKDTKKRKVIIRKYLWLKNIWVLSESDKNYFFLQKKIFFRRLVLGAGINEKKTAYLL